MDDKEFKQQLVLALVSNPEFVKQAKENYNGKTTWFSLTEQVNETIKNVSIELTPK